MPVDRPYHPLPPVEALDAFLITYGLAAACAVMLVKAVGVPIPIPGDVILLATAAWAAEGKVALWLAFVGLLLALVGGGIVQYLLARGPARSVVFRLGRRLGLTPERTRAVAARVERGGPLAIALAVLTPGVRSAAIPGCGLAAVPMRLFVPGLILGSSADLALHFGLGFAGAGLLASVLQPSPLVILAGLL
ncbi:MAG: VTT domain-containing protein, partial [Chloroflexota bacterium]|nr:VTT domain-containing protein [Chloroflexota bacterium]